MNYETRLNEELKQAMRSKNELLLRTVRDLKSRIKLKAIEKGQALTEAEFIKLVQTAAKQRKEAMQLYEQGNRPELVAQERAELELLKAYLPQMMDEAEMQNLVGRVLQETGVTSIRDMGKVMGPLMKAAAGLADGKRLQEIVRERLDS